MKRLILSFFAIIFIFFSTQAQQSVSIGTPDIKSSAVLYLKGTNQGLIIPIVENRNAITGSGGEAGMMVFESNSETLYYHNGETWVAVLPNGGEVDGVVGNEVANVIENRGLVIDNNNPNDKKVGLIPGTQDGQILKWDQTLGKWDLQSDESGSEPETDNSTLEIFEGILRIRAAGVGDNQVSGISASKINVAANGPLPQSTAQVAFETFKNDLDQLRTDVDAKDVSETNEIQTLQASTVPSGVLLSNTATSSGVTLVAGSNITLSESGSNEVTINSTTTGSDSQDLSLNGTTLSLTNDGTSVELGALSILNAVTPTEITDNAVTESKINTSAVTESKIASSAVTSDKIADGSVSLSKLVNDPANVDKVFTTNASGQPTLINKSTFTTTSLAAGSVTVTPDTDLVSTDAQSALEELQDEILLVDQNSTNEIQNLSIADANAGLSFDLGISSGTGITVAEGTNVDLTLAGSTLTISAPTAGEANTASNLGAGEGVFKTKTGSDLQFNSIDGAASGKITATTDATNNVILLDVNEANLAVPPANITHASTANGDVLQIVSGAPAWAPIASTVDQTGQSGILVGDGANVSGVAGGTANEYLRRNATNSAYEFGALSADHISSGTLPITRGGTGATTAADVRSNLGLGTLATLSAVGSTDITNNTITGADLATDISVSTSAALSTSGTFSASGTSAALTSTTVNINGGTTTIEGATFPASDSHTGILINNGLGVMSWSTVGGSQITNNSIDITKLTSAGALDADKVFITNGSGTPTLQTKTSFLSGTLTTSSSAGGDATGTLSALTLSTAAATGGRMVTAINNSTGTIDDTRLDSDVITASESFASGTVRGSFQGGLNIEDGAVTDAKVASGISGSKINPSFTQDVQTSGNVIATGNISAVDATLTGTTTIGGKTYSWPSGVGADASGILTHDGSGGLTWSSATGITEVVAGSGLSGGGTSSSVTLSLSNTGVVSGTYGTGTQIPQITVNGQGRITGVSSIPFTAGLTDPMTTAGDIIFNNATADPARLGIGTNGQVLMVNGSGLPEWQDLTGGGTITGVTTAAGSGLQGGGTTGTLDMKLINGTATGQILKWNGGTNAWELDTDDTGAGGIATLSGGQLLIGDGSVNSAAGVGGDLSMSEVSGEASFQIKTGVVTAGEIADNTITNTDINATANIAVNKLAGGTANQVLQTDALGIPVWTNASSGAIDDLSDVVLSSPSAGHVLVYTSSNAFENKSLTGDISITEGGSATIAAGAISGGVGGKITDNSITADDLANSSVTNAKIQGVSASKINGLSTGYVPRAGATGLSNGSIQDNGSVVGVNMAPAAGTTLSVANSTDGAAQFGGKVTVSGNLVAEGIEITKPLMSNGSTGTAGQVLTSSGATLAPTWETLPTAFTTSNVLPKGDGSQMVASNIYDDGLYVGIGTTNPATELDIWPSGSNTTPRLRLKSSESTGGASAFISIGRDDGVGNFLETGSISDPGSLDALRLSSYNAIQLNVNSANRFTIYSNGELGIGNSGDVGTAGQVLTSGGSGAAPSWTDLPATFSTDNAIPVGDGTQMVASSISDNGSTVSIATSLAVNGTSLIGASNLTVHYPTSTSTSYGGMYVNTTTASRPFYGYAQAGSPIAWTYLDGSDENKWKLNYSGDILTVRSNGNMGIGTTTPSSKLDVEGGLAVGATYSGTTTAPTNGAIIEGNVGVGTNSPQTKFHLYRGTGPSTGAYNGIVSSIIESSGQAVMEINAASWGGVTFHDDNASLRSGMLYDYTNDRLTFRTGGTDYRLSLEETGNVGIGTMNAQNKLDVEGGLAVGATYSGSTAAPTNGAIIQGNVGIGTTTSIYPLSVYSSATSRAMFIDNDYAGSATQYGLTVDMNAGTGSSSKYGIDVNVTGTSASAFPVFGLETDIAPNGTGIAYGVNASISSVGTGTRYGVYSSVGQASGNSSNVYGFYASISDAGTGDAYGIYTTGEDDNYFSGNVGIGVDNPSYKLDLNEDTETGYIASFDNNNADAGSDVLRLRIASTTPNTGSFYLGCYSGATLKGGLRNDGSGGVSLYSASDRRLKENILDFNADALDIVKKIRTRSYNFIGFGKKKVGFIAQELLDVYPDAVSGDPNGDEINAPLMINYNELTPLVIKAMQQQQELIEKQKAEIEKLKAELASSQQNAISTETELKALSAEVMKIKEAIGLEAKQTTTK